MVRVVSSKQMASILAEINSYISYTELQEEKEMYLEELKEVENDFMKLIHSGVFHDACGKVNGVRSCFDEITVFVLTEY
jgi:hypothetical protein